MNKLLVQVYLPASRQSFDFRIPAAMNCQIAAQLAAIAVKSLTDQQFATSHSCLLAWKDTGQLLKIDKSLEEAGVLNGSRLMLI